MEKSIFKYILSHSLRQQIVLTLMAAISFPFLYLFYELPKRIVNEAIQGTRIEFPVIYLGTEFDQLDYLALLVFVFFLLMLVNQAFKYFINVYRGLTGERMLRRLRYDLFSRTLRFPLPVFRKTSQGELIQMISAETEPLGGFIGDAFSLPAFQGGTLIVILAFLLWQNPYMAAAAIALYPIQFYLIPKLQFVVNQLGKQRVRLVRRLSDRIGETVTGIQDVHAHNTAPYELADFASRLGDIFDVRYKIYVWKFVIKFLNNTINQLGPIAFYSIGGYLVIKGELEIGTLLAAIAAHKDLAAPWKELLNYYQRQQDAKIKFEQIVEQFEQPDMWDEGTVLGEPETPPDLSGELSAGNLTLHDDTGTVLVDGTAFSFPLDEHVAVVGPGGSGKDELAILLARLMKPTAGSITVGGTRFNDMPEAVTGRQIGYVGGSAHFVSASLRDNLYYGLKHRPLMLPEYAGAEKTEWERRQRESRLSGNSSDDPTADWIDYAAAGVSNAEELQARTFEVLRIVDMERDIYDFGLRGTIDPARDEELTRRLLEARVALQRRIAEDSELAGLVETFDVEKYNDNATVAENVFFGTVVGTEFDMDRLAEHPYVLRVLEEAGLIDDLLELGREIATTMVELFADLPPGHHLFQQFSFISSEDLPEYQALLARIGRGGMQELRPEDRTMLMSLPFKLQPARHRLGVMTDERRARLLQARRIFAENLPGDLAGSVEFYRADRYNAAASLQDNVLFGKLAYGQAHGAERVGRLIGEIIDELDLRGAVREVGLDFHVGIGGGRLSTPQRQKLALARALLKRPKLLIVNDALTTLDNASQVGIMERVLEASQGRGVIWVVNRASLAMRFDRVLVMQGGKVIESGAPGELNGDGKALRQLVEAE